MHTFFGEALNMDQLPERIQRAGMPDQAGSPPLPIWLGSVGYERHRDHRAFARHLAEAGVERLIDVRELAISRRRGFAKNALTEALNDAGVGYVHVKALGNPKPLRDVYKSGKVEEGRSRYRAYLRSEHLDVLRELVPLLKERRSALMCVEHHSQSCHRSVIIDVLRKELGLELEVAEID